MSARAWLSSLALGCAFWLIVGLLIVAVTRAGLPDNSWLGLKAFAAYDGSMASCSLGAASGTDSVWSAVTGSASLDIVQVGALVSSGNPRWFAAYGHGEPGAAGSAYTQVDLGATDRGSHRYTVQLISGAWSLSIDGVTRLRVPAQPWTIRAAQVQNEVMVAGERMGGTWLRPVSCTGARVHTTAGWSLPAWSFQGAGGSAAVAVTSQGADWFRVGR